MRRQVKRGNVERLTEFDLGKATAGILLDRSDAEHLCSYLITTRPGTISPKAFHRVAEEILIVLKGTVLAQIDDSEELLHEGDFVFIPPSVPHGFITGDEEAKVLSVLSPGVDRDTDFYLVEDDE